MPKHTYTQLFAVTLQSEQYYDGLHDPVLVRLFSSRDKARAHITDIICAVRALKKEVPEDDFMRPRFSHTSLTQSRTYKKLTALLRGASEEARTALEKWVDDCTNGKEVDELADDLTKNRRLKISKSDIYRVF